MIHFENLKFVECPGSPDGNSKAELSLENGYGYDLDIIKKPKTRTYKVKPFEKVFDKKRYLGHTFPEHGKFPEFNGREPLIEFLNQIDKHNLSEPSEKIEVNDEDIEPESYDEDGEEENL